MGSLMAGWDCNIPDPQVVKYKRNKSLTKEEIKAFWRSKEHKEANHEPLSDSSMLSPASCQIQANEDESTKTTYEASSSDEEKLIKKHGWWVSSSLAHLNERPVLASEHDTYKRVSFFKPPQTG
ncbi:unnamed protein product [Withania somnifera]